MFKVFFFLLMEHVTILDPVDKLNPRFSVSQRGSLQCSFGNIISRGCALISTLQALRAKSQDMNVKSAITASVAEV